MCLDLSPNVHRFLKNNFTWVVKQTNSNLLCGLHPDCKLLSTQDFLPPVQRVLAQAAKASWMAAVNTFSPIETSGPEASISFSISSVCESIVYWSFGTKE